MPNDDIIHNLQQPLCKTSINCAKYKLIAQYNTYAIVVTFTYIWHIINKKAKTFPPSIFMNRFAKSMGKINNELVKATERLVYRGG